MEDKIFITSQGQIERFDVEFNNPSRLGFLNGIKNGNIVKLGDIIHDQGYGILPPSNSYNSESEIIYLRATELNPDLKIDFNSCLKVPKKYYSNNRAILKKNDILIAVKGATIASKKSVAYIENDIGKAILNGSIFRFQTIENINSKYVAYILDSDLGKKQMKFGLVANNAVDYLNKETLENLKIPLPPLEIQNQIVEKMDRALEIKKQKEKEAKQLLESIDDFVLGELGIEYEEVEEKKIFGINLNELGESKRFDSFYNNPKFLELEKMLKNGKYKLGSIGDKLLINKKLENINAYNYINYVDLSCVSNKNGTIKNIKTLEKQKIPSRARQKINKGDLLISSLSGSMKSIGIVKEEKENLICSTGFIIVKTSKEYFNYFLYGLLKTQIYQDILISQTAGGIMSAISSKDFEKIKIPLPPLEIQEKIANEVKSRIEKANILEKEAREIYESAKKEVEGIILGK